MHAVYAIRHSVWTDWTFVEDHPTSTMQVRMRASDVLLTLVMNVPTTHKIVQYCLIVMKGSCLYSTVLSQVLISWRLTFCFSMLLVKQSIV